MLTIQGKALGRKKPLFADWSVPFPPEFTDGGVTLRDVITSIVRSEVEAFRKRQSDRQFLKALTAAEIDVAAQSGKIVMGESEVPRQEVDPDFAIGTALQAFEDGLYLVIVDDEEQRDLDRQIYLQDDSRITFVRLTLLAGG